MRRLVVVTCTLLSFAMPAFAQTPPPAAQLPAPQKTWSFFASAYTYIIPDASDYVQPSFSADRERLHLEARYNYEAKKTGSAWIGANFSGGSTVEWELTPIFGVVFGDLDGVAPGYKGSITWRKLSLYSESEYVIDTANTSDSFLYNWSELTYAITDSFRAGLVVQRTRVYQTDRDVQRGIIFGYSYKRAEFTLAIFNPDEDKPTSAFSIGFRF
jgi:hypothetical protein